MHNLDSLLMHYPGWSYNRVFARPTGPWARCSLKEVTDTWKWWIYGVSFLVFGQVQMSVWCQKGTLIKYLTSAFIFYFRFKFKSFLTSMTSLYAVLDYVKFLTMELNLAPWIKKKVQNEKKSWFSWIFKERQSIKKGMNKTPKWCQDTSRSIYISRLIWLNEQLGSKGEFYFWK